MTRRTRRAATLAGLVLGAAAWVAAAGAAPPPPGRCPTVGGGAAAGDVDAGVPLFREGDRLGSEDLKRIRQLLPPELWTWREAFFFEGMRLEIGFCHRVYPTAAFYSAATHANAGTAELDDEGNLVRAASGLPFPPERVDADDPRVAAKWAWNLALRYRGAGPIGSFRLMDLPGRIGSSMLYEGDFFWLQTGHRADLAASDGRVPEARKHAWVAGGRFEKPFDARHLAWRQLRPLETFEKWKEPDDTFVYVPTMRKPRRAASVWVDGLFTPTYRVSGDTGGGGVPIGVGAGSPDAFGTGIESIQPTAGLSAAATEHLRRGFTGLTLRPNAWSWRWVEEREVLAPLNAAVAGWPVYEDKNYGPSGLSPAMDRWDVRQAVVIEGRARRRIDEMAAARIWIDWQTRQPLYWITLGADGRLLDVGVLVHRFSGDTPRYPTWPDGSAANVFDPVAAFFYYVPGGGSGWRRESWDVRSLPIEGSEIRRRVSTDHLIRGR